MSGSSSHHQSRTVSASSSTSQGLGKYKSNQSSFIRQKEVTFALHVSAHEFKSQNVVTHYQQQQQKVQEQIINHHRQQLMRQNSSFDSIKDMTSEIVEVTPTSIRIRPKTAFRPGSSGQSRRKHGSISSTSSSTTPRQDEEQNIPKPKIQIRHEESVHESPFFDPQKQQNEIDTLRIGNVNAKIPVKYKESYGTHHKRPMTATHRGRSDTGTKVRHEPSAIAVHTFDGLGLPTREGPVQPTPPKNISRKPSTTPRFGKPIEHTEQVIHQQTLHFQTPTSIRKKENDIRDERYMLKKGNVPMTYFHPGQCKQRAVNSVDKCKMEDIVINRIKARVDDRALTEEHIQLFADATLNANFSAQKYQTIFGNSLGTREEVIEYLKDLLNDIRRQDMDECSDHEDVPRLGIESADSSDSLASGEDSESIYDEEASVSNAPTHVQSSQNPHIRTSTATFASLKSDKLTDLQWRLQKPSISPEDLKCPYEVLSIMPQTEHLAVHRKLDWTSVLHHKISNMNHRMGTTRTFQ